MISFLKRIGLEPFVLALFFVILLAWLYPEPGAGTGPFSLAAFSHYGVSVIFFFYGLRLNWEKIRSGLLNIRLHMVVMCGTFILFPTLILLVMAITGNIPTTAETAKLTAGEGMTAESSRVGLWLGIFFLATLPSTVSSSVVMVNLAKGNVPAAIFDASISSLLGVFITPLWMRIFLTAETGGMGLSQVILSLIFQVVVPIGLGISLHHLLGWFSKKYDSQLKKFDQSIILLIVYTSFCHSFKEEMFAGLSMGILLLLSSGMVTLFFSAYLIIDFVCRLWKFNREDRITTLFCGSKKSLVHGTVMSCVLLKDPRMAGVLLLPTMIYHALQLIIVSIIAQKFAHHKPDEQDGH